MGLTGNNLFNNSVEPIDSISYDKLYVYVYRYV